MEEDYPNYGGDFEDEEEDEDGGVDWTPSEGKDFQDITETSKEDLLDQFNEDPKGFLANYGRQLRAGLVEDGDAKMLNEYIQKNPDLLELWEKEEIQAHMEKHPEDDVIATHKQLAGRTSSQQEKDMVARISRNIQAGRKSK